MSGAGVPQVTAIMDVYEEIHEKIPICADGGIREPGDIVKAIGAGADTVMCGSIFAGTEETPGQIIDKDGKKYKLYRGMASYDATIKRLTLEGKKPEVISVEGEKVLVEYRGSIESVVKRFLGGLASGMTYTGSNTIDDLRARADFIEISTAGHKESTAHGLEKKC
jgi:IMP dehydrogenase